MTTFVRPSTLVLAAITALVAALLYSPLFVPIVSSFFTIKGGQVDWAAPTASAYTGLAGNGEILTALRTTLIVGFSTVILSVVSGTLLALYTHGRRKGRQLLQFIIFLPFLMPPVISGLALLIFFREINFERSLVTVVIGHTVFVLAIVYRTILTRLEFDQRHHDRGVLRPRGHPLADLLAHPHSEPFERHDRRCHPRLRTVVR